MKLGVLGGTFDPIHLGHLAAAEAARSALALDRVLFVPAGDPWLKAGATISPGEHRLAMVRAAIAGVPAYEASTVELDRPGPTYTEVTLAQLQETYGADTELHFIVGADTVHDLARWHEPAAVLARCTLVVMGRPRRASSTSRRWTASRRGLRPRCGRRPGHGGQRHGDTPSRRGGGIAGGTGPDAVERYIREHKLYEERA